MRSVDIVVAGAGAAGLVAGIAAAERGSSVVILDSRAKIGAKILAAGGGRCNVTNEYVAPSCFNGGPERFTGRVLRAFGLDATLRFFESIGAPLTLEESGKYFPASNTCLLYTSDAADDLPCVDLGGRRIIKKKT